jgi:hypothetical protein
LSAITREYDEGCACGQCGAWATILEYRCGCIIIDVHGRTVMTKDCTNYDPRRRRCGKPDHPDMH